MASKKMREFIAMVPGGATVEGSVGKSHHGLTVVLARVRGAKTETPTETPDEIDPSTGSGPI